MVAARARQHGGKVDRRQAAEEGKGPSLGKPSYSPLVVRDQTGSAQGEEDHERPRVVLLDDGTVLAGDQVHLTSEQVSIRLKVEGYERRERETVEFFERNRTD